MGTNPTNTELANPRVLEVDNLWAQRGIQTDDEFRQNALKKGYTQDEIESVVQSESDTPSKFQYPQQPKKDLTKLKNILSTLSAAKDVDMDDISQYILETTDYGYDDIDNALAELQSSQAQTKPVDAVGQEQKPSSQEPSKPSVSEVYDQLKQSENFSDDLAKEYLASKGYTDDEISKVIKSSIPQPEGFRIMEDEEYHQMADAYVELGEDALKQKLIASGMYSKDDAEALLKNFKMSNYIKTKSVLDPRMLKPDLFVTSEFNLSPQDQKTFEKMYADAPAKRLGLDLMELLSGSKVSMNSLITGVSKVISDALGISDSEVAKAISDSYGAQSEKERRRHLVQTGINKFDISDISPTDLYLPAKGASVLAKTAKTLAVQGGGAYAHAKGSGKSEGEAQLIGAISGVTPLAIDGIIKAASAVSKSLGSLFVTEKQLAKDVIDNYGGHAQKFIEDLETLNKLGIEPTIPDFVSKDSASAWTTRLAQSFNFLKDPVTSKYLNNAKVLNEAVDDVLGTISTKDVAKVSAEGKDLAAVDFSNIVTKYFEILKGEENKAYEVFRKEADKLGIPSQSLDKLKNLADTFREMDHYNTLRLGMNEDVLSNEITSRLADFESRLADNKVTGQFLIDLEQFLNEQGRGELSAGSKSIIALARNIKSDIKESMLKSAPKELQDAYNIAESLAKGSSKEVRELFTDPSNVRNISIFGNTNQVESTQLFDKFYVNQTDLKLTKLSEIMDMYKTMPKEFTSTFTKEDFLKKFLANHLKRNLSIKSFDDVLKLSNFADSVEKLLHWQDKGFLKSIGIEKDKNLKFAIDNLITLGKYANKLSDTAKSIPSSIRFELSTIFYRMLDVIRAGLSKLQASDSKRLAQLAKDLKTYQLDLDNKLLYRVEKQVGKGLRESSKFAEQLKPDEV